MLHRQASQAILAKSRAKYGQRLTGVNYNEMISMSSVPEIAAYLKTSTHYSAISERMTHTTIHRAELEHYLHAKIFHDFAQLCRFERSLGAHFFEYILLRRETDEILNFFRYLVAGRPQDYLLAMPSFFNQHTSLDLVRLSKCVTFDDVLEAVRESKYYKMLKPFRPAEGQSVDYTMIENMLDKYVYSELLRLIRSRFKGDEREQMQKLFGMKADIENIKCIYRSKKYYDSSLDVIRARKIDYYGYLSKRQVENMIYAEDADGFINLLRNTYYGKFFSTYEDKEIDEIVLRLLYKKCRKYIRFSKYPVVVMASCMLLFEFEIDDITNIIEGVRYKLPPEKIRNMLITIEE